MADNSNGSISQPPVQKMEYDASIGGHFRLENDLTTFNYCHNHMREINALTMAIRNPNTTKLVFQKLPKHMRRRAMSHNPNRLPRKYRMAHCAQMAKSGAPAQTKRPSRKFRRKPKNLGHEYQRRQRKCAWLETHIWHAKRFHMIEKWGYKLAASSCDKTFRSSYRATVKHCLLQDISYMGCIELRGQLELLRTGFDRMRGIGTGLGICAKAYLNGRREGSIELFAIDSYPFKAFGRVQFMWQRKLDTATMHRVWLFVHPSIHKTLIDEFCKLFDMEDIVGDESTPASAIFANADKSIELYDLKQYVNRFRLTGPLSNSILAAAFKPKNVRPANDKTWFADYLNDTTNAAFHDELTSYWTEANQAKTSNELPTNAILSINIEDPRINRPKKRTKPNGASNDNKTSIASKLHEMLPANSGDSILWHFDICNRIKREKVSTHEICVQRNKDILVPGERCSFENTLQPIPVVLIQRPGSQNPNRLGYGSGYDVIIPAEYGLSTWMCLIMWGAKPGALRETETIAREAMDDEFAPDTEAARIGSDAFEAESRKKYFQKPPSKRRNYTKLSIASPFKCPWEQLSNEWSTKSLTGFYVLRDKRKLDEIGRLLKSHKNAAIPCDIDEGCLIPVALEMNGRGMANKFSIICLPTKNDLQNNVKHSRQFNNTPVLSEPTAHDPHEHKRKQMRTKHLMLLKRLRRRRVRVKRKRQEYSERKVIIAPAKTAQLIETQFKQMCQLWLPSQPPSIRNQCSREVFGYLSLGQFSLHAGKVSGVGYVAVNGLRQLLKTNYGGKMNQVLVRDPNNANYRVATLSIRSI